MKMYAPDGTPLHTAQQQSSLTNRFGLYGILGTLEGVVLRAFYKDDSANKSKAWTEYTLIEVSTRTQFRNARLLADVSGFEIGKEDTLAETTGTTDGSQLVLEEEGMVAAVTAQVISPTSTLGLTPTTKLNGERVMFACVGGAYSQPVIIGALPHTESPYFATRQDAPRHLRVINGWTHAFAADSSLVFRHQDGRKIVANADGSIDVFPKDGSIIRLGGDTFSAVRGETNNSNIDGVIAAINGVIEAVNTYTAAIMTTVDPPVPPAVVGPITAALTTALAAVTSSLSTISGTLDQALSPTPKVP